MERLSTLLRRGQVLPADELVNNILETVADFRQEVAFNDHVTILVVSVILMGHEAIAH